jgi:hypothetical protein
MANCSPNTPQKDADRNFPLNIQSFVPFNYSQQQQLMLQKQQQDLQRQSHNNINNSNKLRISHLGQSVKETPFSSINLTEYGTSTDEEDVCFFIH